MKRLFITCLLACLALACEDEYVSNIPVTLVNFDLDLAYQDQVLNGAATKIFTSPRRATDRMGFGGLLVFNPGDGNLVAFDLACQVEAQSNVRVAVNDVFEAVCPKCGATYSLYSGGAPKSVAKLGLQRYRVSSTGASQYRVTN